MAHKTTIDGTSYGVVGGRTLVDGTVYDINQGRTLVNGTEYDILFGVKWIKFDCKVTTQTTYTQEIPTQFKLNINESADRIEYSYADYYFTTTNGFIGGTQIKHDNGKNMTGYHVTDTDVYEYGNDKVDLGSGWIEYHCKNVAHARKTVTTIYSKGDTSHGSIYADPMELPEEGQLIEGSPSDSYCIIKINGTCYYYERV